MKRTILILFLILAGASLKAQVSKIDIIVAQYPTSFDRSEDLAALVNRDFESDADKARAIYSWICTRVAFDTDAHFSKKKRKRMKYKDKVDRAQKLRKERINKENKALNRHLATSEGYATLYQRLCELCDVYGYMLRGTAKLRVFDIGKLPRMQNHYWNVVQIDKKWYFVDATLGSGMVDYSEKTYHPDFNEQFFFTSPEVFFFNHYPKETEWLKVEKTEEDFAKLPLYHSEFLKHGFEISEPLEGLLDLKGADSIQFKMSSPVPLEKLSYQFNYEKEASDVIVEKINNEYTFAIPFVVKRRGYLTLYYNDKAILSYKINMY